MNRSEVVIVGIDPSLRSTGIVVLPAPFWHRGRFRWRKVVAKSTGFPLEKTATDDERAERLAKITGDVMSLVLNLKVTFAVVAGHVFGQHGAMAFERAELVGAIKRDLFAYKIPIRTVADTSARKLMLGKNPRVNPKGVAEVFINAAGGRFETDDEYDAFVFANWGLAELGFVALASEPR